MASNEPDGTSTIILDIINQFKSHPCFFDKEDAVYNISTATQRAYATIVKEVNKNLPKGDKITEDDVKRKWRILRKAMTAYFSGKASKKYYLVDKLEFSIPHLRYKVVMKNEKSTEQVSENEDENCENRSGSVDDECNNENGMSARALHERK
ncbi:hypothetical protein QAD02_014052 [Eretmocerus hayati]|uniref:Uncharacterized protein n=1 Tax=Eretmocerus hayati TaxID=131215 RepID=A0ACC2P3V1_9HYME|nr:hypothetical protein QAD02_014052 [Eretmocerus hayati]